MAWIHTIEKAGVSFLTKLCTSAALAAALTGGATFVPHLTPAAEAVPCPITTAPNIHTVAGFTATSVTPTNRTQILDVRANCGFPNLANRATIRFNDPLYNSVASGVYESPNAGPALIDSDPGGVGGTRGYIYEISAATTIDGTRGVTNVTSANQTQVGIIPLRIGAGDTVNNDGSILGDRVGVIAINSPAGAPAIDFNNNGIISAVNLNGILSIRPDFNLINTGSISSSGISGIDLRGQFNTVDNRAGATISGGQVGVVLRDVVGNMLDYDLTNAGTIQGTVGIKMGVQDVTVDIVNTGNITGTGGDAILAATGSGRGVSIINEGTITGDIRLSLSNLAADTFLTTTGGVNSTSQAGYAAGTNTTAGNGNDTLEIRPGSNITGIVDAGIGNDTFILGGAGVATINAGEFDGDGNFTPPPGGAEKYTGFENHFKRGSSQWIMTGTNGETGLWQVQGGELTVDATMGGWAMDVTSATLSGTGTVGATVMNGGSTLAPGNPSGGIANFNVNGDLTFGNGSTYSFSISRNDSDTIFVDGDVNINGGSSAQQVIGDNLTPIDFQTVVRYDIIQINSINGNPTGIVNGTFSSPALNTPLVNYQYEYAPDRVSLIRTIVVCVPPDPNCTTSNPLQFNLNCDYLRTFRPFTFNQCQAALGLTGFDFTLDRDVYNNLAELTADQLARALDALTGEIHSESAKAGAEITKEFDELLMAISVNRRANGTINEVLLGAPETASTAYGADLDPQLAPVIDEDDYNKLWFGGLGAHVQIDEDGNAGGPLVNTYGLGGGVHMNHTWWGKGTLGVAAGYTRSTVNIQNRYQSSDIDTAHIGIYGSGGADRLEEGFAARGAASYAYHWVDTVRDIEFGYFDFVAPIDRTAKANYTGQTVSADIEAKYNFLFETDNFGTAALSPYVRATIQRTKFSRFQEEGARFINLSGQAETYTPATVAVGAMLTGEYEFDKGWIWRPSAALAYEHYFHGGDVFTGLDYDGSTQPFLVAGAAESSHRIRFSTMSDLAINDRFSLTFATDNVFNSDRFDVSAKAGLKMDF